MRTADRRPSENVNDVANGKLINTLTEKHLKKGSVEQTVFISKRKVRDLLLRVLKLMKLPRVKYGKCTKGYVEIAQKVRYCHGKSTVT